MGRYSSKVYSLLAATLLSCASVEADEHVVGQLNKAFSTDHLIIKVGDVVKFENNDAFYHNVFSLSDTKFFDLGSYPQGESRDVVFDKPGEVDVECAIHPGMRMTIKVQ